LTEGGGKTKEGGEKTEGRVFSEIRPTINEGVSKKGKKQKTTTGRD